VHRANVALRIMPTEALREGGRIHVTHPFCSRESIYGLPIARSQRVVE
jgi:hypothetical protein